MNQQTKKLIQEQAAILKQSILALEAITDLEVKNCSKFQEGVSGLWCAAEDLEQAIERIERN